MLLQFTVENYKSFNEPTTFSMSATGIRELPKHVIDGKSPALRGAAIYGKNAAGKSNLVLAMGFARDLIVRPATVGRRIATTPCRLRTDNNRVSSFRWFFQYKGRIWQYGFSVEAKGVVEEYLYARNEKGGKELKWFTRETVDNEVQVSFGQTLRGPAHGKRAKRLELIRSNIRKRPEQLFLPFAIENSVEELITPYEWFTDVLVVKRAENTYSDMLWEVNDDSFLGFLGEFLKFADTEIHRLQRTLVALKWDSVFPSGFPSEA
ncbi:MAG TPA: AAA family ATPase, partial [Abditibacteriaceae bacterium]